MSQRGLLALLFSLCVTVPAMARPLVVGYVPNWIDVEAYSKTIAYEKVTHLNVAFENPVDDEGNLSFNANEEGLIRRAREKKVKILVSIGGGSASSDQTLLARYSLLLSTPKRVAFVDKLVKFVQAHRFDGIDVDLEGPSIGPDYGAFIEALSKACRAKGLIVTAAWSRGYGGDKVPNSAFAQLDFVNIMAYDGTGPWSPGRPGPHSTFDFAKDNVEYWLKRGLPKNKAVLGLPFYGWGFGTAAKSGDYPFSRIIQDYPGAHLVDEIGDRIYYNGLPTIRAKAEYVKKEGLAGVMIWSLDHDATGEHSLLDAIHRMLLGLGMIQSTSSPKT